MMPERARRGSAEIEGILNQVSRSRCRNDDMSAIFFTAAEVCVVLVIGAGLFRKRAVLRPAVVRSD